jgi:D-glycero-D-manno-heptose 1,7-bisphosphate phosphatase
VSRPAVFLDRDGTLVEEAHYLDRLDRLALFPWSVDAVRLLARAGFAVIVVSNQSGVARGFFDEAFVEATHRRLDALLAAGGARVDGYYYCPHHPEGAVAAYRVRCECRKPAPGMLRRAAAEHDLDLARSVVVGDRWEDIGLAAAVGAPGVLVRTGHGARLAAQPPEGPPPACVAANLIEATTWILRRRGSSS